MKKLLFMVAALAAFTFTSCNSDDDIQGLVNNGDMEEVTFSINPDTGVKTKAAAPKVEDYNLRYILEVWSTGTTPARIGSRYEHIVAYSGSAYPSGTFSLSVPKGSNFDVVVWVDYVTTAAATSAAVTTPTTDNHYVTTSLNAITRKGSWAVGMDDQDAYTAVEHWTSGTGATSITAKRPFAQINIAASDKDKWNSEFKYTEDQELSVSITITAPSTYNAVKGDVETTTSSVTVAQVTKADDTPEMPDQINYYSGLIFAPTKGEGYDKDKLFSIDITATMETNTGTLSPTAYTLTNVPLTKNWSTNISGNLFIGEATNFTITTDTAFDTTGETHNGDFDSFKD